MIVYNVARRFFEKKLDAEAHRKAEGLRSEALNKITITDRAGLAEFLNQLCADAAGRPPIALDDAALDFVPAFVEADWERRRRFRLQMGGGE